ncbi:unnamed protein product [Clavelina lepadiformis]|uniref:Uncharacterized protein n=1 Tax=Clavelina lepadiformis TaxID=159417 RepID=A0ABP0GEY0_CLALP
MDPLTARRFAAVDCSGQRFAFRVVPPRYQFPYLPLSSVPSSTVKLAKVSTEDDFKTKATGMLNETRAKKDERPMDPLTARRFAAVDCSGQRFAFRVVPPRYQFPYLPLSSVPSSTVKLAKVSTEDDFKTKAIPSWIEPPVVNDAIVSIIRVCMSPSVRWTPLTARRFAAVDCSGQRFAFRVVPPRYQFPYLPLSSVPSSTVKLAKSDGPLDGLRRFAAVDCSGQRFAFRVVPPRYQFPYLPLSSVPSSTVKLAKVSTEDDFKTKAS